MDARYARQLALPGFGVAGQQRLGAARVLVIGAGGLGSTVIPALAGAGVGTIGVVDDDRVELSNLHRQTMHAGRIGEPKAASAAELIAALGATAIPITERLTSDNALRLFAGFDLVLDGSDNFPTRYLANDAAELTGIPLVWGAVSQYGGQAGISWGGVGYRDLFPVAPPPGSVPSCEVGGVLPTTVAVIGAIMATEAIKLLSGVGEPLLGRVTTYDALTGAFREIPYARDPAAPPVTGLIDYELFCGVGPTGDRAEPRSDQPTGDRAEPRSTPSTGSRLRSTTGSRLRSTTGEITPAELAERTDEFLLLDVREPWEVAIASLPEARPVPLGSLDEAEFDPGVPVVVYCHRGVRSARARDRLAERGIRAVSLAGGIDAWSREIDESVPRY